MSIHVYYTLYTECPEEDLLLKLNRVRTRLLSLPLKRVSAVTRIDPVFNIMHIKYMESLDLPIPLEVATRTHARRSKTEQAHSLMMSMCPVPEELPEAIVQRYFLPAVQMLDHPALWDEKDYPKNLHIGMGYLRRPRAYLLEFVNALLRYGYVIEVDPGEGCEPVDIALSTFRSESDLLVWLGWGGCKTQYANPFKQAHENVCRVLDVAQEEGLLFEAEDNSSYYDNRDWNKSLPLVRQELLFVRAAASMMKSALEGDEGNDQEMVSSPALDYCDALDSEQPENE